MCYSLKSSIISYTIAMMSALVALMTNQIPLGMLILFYCQVQLGEGIIWKGIDENNLNLNKMGTNVIKYSLPSHLIGLGLGILISYSYVYNRYNTHNTHNTHNKYNKYIPLVIGILLYFCVYMLYLRNDKTEYTFPYKKCVKRECQNNENRLVWKFIHVPWYKILAILLLLLYFLYVKDSIYSRLFVISFFTITYLISRFTKLSPKEIKPSSIWCFMSAILAPLVVGINYYIIRHK